MTIYFFECVNGITGKFTDGIEQFVYFYRLIPPDGSTQTKRYLSLIPRLHIHQTVANRRARTVFPGTIFPGSFFPDFFSGDLLSEDFSSGHFFPGDFFSRTFFRDLINFIYVSNFAKIYYFQYFIYETKRLFILILC